MQLDILNEKEAAAIRELIAASSHIVLLGHKSPDGDALGACLGCTDYLQSMGKSSTIIIPDAFPDFLRWLPGAEHIVRYDKQRELVKKLIEEADLIFCLDFNSAMRLDEMSQLLLEAKATKVMIDHHLQPDLVCAVSVSHPEATSTSELVFRIIWQLKAFDQMTLDGATAIYCGMMTDTGGFTFNSSRPEIFFIICQLLTKGIDKDKIYRNVFNNYSSWAIRLRGYMMYQKLNVLDDFHASYYALTRQEMKRFHFIKGDAEGLVNEPLRIKGLKLSIALREDDRRDHLVWVSLRSVDDFPCNQMAAEYFNGGGHLNASGGRLECTLDEAVQITRQAIAAYGNLLKS